MIKNIVIILLAVTSILFMMLYFNSETKKEYYYYLSLNGESQSWRISDYKIIVTPEKRESGGGKISYIGDYERYPTKISYQIFHKASDEQPYASGAQHQIRTETISMGGGGYGKENQEPFEEIRKKFVRITWTGKDGNQYIEEMYMETNNLFSMFD